MPKCPYCGSTAHPVLTDTQWVEDGWTIIAQRSYSCACGCYFNTESVYVCEGLEEVVFAIEPTPTDAPSCPKCGSALVEDDCIDMVSTDAGLDGLCVGYCPSCNVNYQWRKKFTFEGFDRVVECH
jgi:hypothetical protein